MQANYRHTHTHAGSQCARWRRSVAGPQTPQGVRPLRAGAALAARPACETSYVAQQCPLECVPRGPRPSALACLSSGILPRNDQRETRLAERRPRERPLVAAKLRRLETWSSFKRRRFSATRSTELRRHRSNAAACAPLGRANLCKARSFVIPVGLSSCGWGAAAARVGSGQLVGQRLTDKQPPSAETIPISLSSAHARRAR
jgi:hypothetical protein